MSQAKPMTKQLNLNKLSDAGGSQIERLPDAGRFTLFGWSQYILSFLIVAFGQPAWCGFLAPCSALFGYALFWKKFQGKFWLSTAWFSAVQLIQLSWMTAIEFQGIYILFVWVGLGVWLGCQFGLLSFLIKPPLNLRKILGAASFWTLMEWGRMHVLCGFSFNPVGLSLSASVYSLQYAAVFGVLGLSFWVIFINLLALSRRYFLWGACALFPYLFGLFHLSFHNHEINSQAKVALVQTGLLPSEKALLSGRGDAYISPLYQWQRIIHLLKQEENEEWDVIVLPEAVVPFAAEEAIYPLERVKKVLNEEGVSFSEISKEKTTNLFWLKALSHHFNAQIIAGLDSKDSRERYFAAGYSYCPAENQWHRYEKRILVPLAEYLPFSFLKPWVASYGIVDFFTPGIEAKVFNFKSPFSLSICYEETFPDLMRESRRKGAELFINLTNDNWYPSSRLPEQHFALGRLRSVENGVPLLRACNSGVTAAIDSLGRTVATLEGKAGVLSTTVDLYSYKTLYSFWGNGGIVALSLFFIVLFLRNHSLSI